MKENEAYDNLFIQKLISLHIIWNCHSVFIQHIMVSKMGFYEFICISLKTLQTTPSIYIADLP